jgi:hypothetical protein
MAKKQNYCISKKHPICTSSDSKLPECLCWCAECKDIMRQWVSSVVMRGVK